MLSKKKKRQKRHVDEDTELGVEFDGAAARGREPLAKREAYTIMASCAAGLQYLHAFQPPLILMALQSIRWVRCSLSRCLTVSATYCSPQRDGASTARPKRSR